MVGENFLSEEETLKELQINKAQLEEFIRLGKILPSYQDGQRRFKATEVEKIKSTLSESPPVEAPPPEETSSPTVPPPTTEEVGSTRIIEPPKESPRLKVKKQAPPSEKPKFLKEPPKGVGVTPNIGKLNGVLLSLSLIILIISVVSLYFTWKGAPLPNILLTLLKTLSQLGG